MKRLFEDPELSSELRDDLLRSRSAGHDYPEAAKLMQLRAALSDTTRNPLGDEPPKDAARAQHLGRSLAHPAWKIIAVATLATTAALVMRPTAQQPQPTPPTAADATTAPVPTPRTEVVAPEPAPTPSAVDTESTPAPPVEVPVSATPKGTASSAGAPAPKSSRREIAQLVRIRGLLDRDPAAAYRLIQQSEREFPRGLLSEERRALAIVALARTGAAEQAEQNARQFFQRYPQSPLRARIQTALKR